MAIVGGCGATCSGNCVIVLTKKCHNQMNLPFINVFDVIQIEVIY